MTDRDFFPASEGYEARATEAVLAMANDLERTVVIAGALLQYGRSIDLTGLDNGVGLLCAKSLDLPPGQGRAVRARLTSLLAALNQLEQLLHAQSQDLPANAS